MSNSTNICPGSAQLVPGTVITRAPENRDRPSVAGGGASRTGASAKHQGLPGSPNITMASAGNGSEGVNNLTDGFSGREFEPNKPSQERQRSRSLPPHPRSTSQVESGRSHKVNVFHGEEESLSDDRLHSVDKPSSEKSHKTDKFSFKTPEAAVDSGSVKHQAHTMDSVEVLSLEDVKHLPLNDSDTEADDICVKACFEAEVYDPKNTLELQVCEQGPKNLNLNAYQWKYLTSEINLWNCVKKNIDELLMTSMVNTSEREHNQVTVSFRRNRGKPLLFDKFEEWMNSVCEIFDRYDNYIIWKKAYLKEPFDNARKEFSRILLLGLKVRFIEEVDDDSIVIVTDKENKERVYRAADLLLKDVIHGTLQDVAVKKNWDEQNKGLDQTTAEARENVTEPPEENEVGNQKQKQHCSYTRESSAIQGGTAKSTNQASKDGSTESMSVSLMSNQKSLHVHSYAAASCTCKTDTNKHKKVKIALIIDADGCAKYQGSYSALRNVSELDHMTEHTVLADQRLIVCEGYDDCIQDFISEVASVISVKPFTIDEWSHHNPARKVLTLLENNLKFLLNNKEVQSQVSKQLLAAKFVCKIENNQLQIWHKLHADPSSAEDIISRAVKHRIVSLKSHQDTQFQDFKKFIEEHFELVGVYQHEGNAWVAFLSSEIDSIDRRIKEYEDTLVKEEYFEVVPDDEYRFHESYSQETIKMWSTDENNVITLKKCNKGCGFLIIGSRNSILRAKTAIQEITPVPKTFPVDHDHLEWLQSPDGKTFLQDVEKRNSCIISMKDSIDSTFEPKDVLKVNYCYSMGSGKCAKLVTGDIRSLQPDVIAVPVWGEQKADRASLEAYLQKYGIDVDVDRLKESSQLSSARKNFVCFSEAKIDETAVVIAFVLMPPGWGRNENQERSRILMATSELLKEVYKRYGQRKIVLDLKEIHENATEKGVKAVFFAVADVFLKEGKLLVELFLSTEDTQLADSLKTAFIQAAGRGDMPSKKRPILTVGRLAHTKADVLVNTTSQKLELDQGDVSKSLLKEAGKDIQKQCNTKYPSGIKLGQIAETGAGNIKHCKAIYHGALPYFDKKGSMETEQKHLLNFVYMCLLSAEKAGHGSIAFPAIGAGKLGYKHDMVSKAMFDAVETFYKENPSSEMLVTFVLFDGDRKVIQHFYAEEVVRDYELKRRDSQCSVLRFHPKDELLVQVVQGELKDYKGTDEVFVLLEEDKSLDFLKNLQMTMSERNRVKHELHHSKTTRITAHELGRCPLTVWVYNRQKFWESFKKILKKKDSLHVFIPSTGQKSFASQLVNSLKDTKKLDGSLYTITIVVPSESLFKEFSQQSKPEWAWYNWIPSFGMSDWSPEKVNRSSIPKVGAIKITASKMETVEQAYEMVMRKICDTLYPKESGALASSTEEEFVDVGSEVDDLNSNEQEFEENVCLMLPSETTLERVFMTLSQEKITVNGILKPNLLYHPHHQVMVFASANDAAWSKESLASYKPEMLPTNLSRNTTLALRQEEIEKVSKKDFLFATGITLAESATYVHGNFVQIIAAHSFLDEAFSSATSKDVVSKQTPSHKNTKDSENIEEISGIQYRAAMHLIGTSELGKAVSEKHSDSNSDQMFLLFHDNPGANQVKQRILGFNTETVEIHGQIDANKDVVLKGVMYDHRVYAESSPDGKSVVIISEEWNEQSAAKKKIQVKFGQVKTSSRAKRTFHENTNKPLVVNDPLQHSTPEQRIDEPGSRVFTVGSVSVHVYSADITTLKVDAIVNAANGNLSHGSGVARAIRDAAGDALDDEGRRYVHNNGPIPVSGVVRTTAGRMPCRMVLHAVGPSWYDYKDYEKQKCEDDLCKTILRCLIEASNAGAAIVAIPAISSGIFRVPKQKCCDAYVRATKIFGMWKDSKKCLTEVHFVDKSETMLQMIASTFSQSKHSTITPRPEEERFMKVCMQQGVCQHSRSRGRQTSSIPQGGQTTQNVSESHTVSAVKASYTYSVNGKGMVKLYTGDIVKASVDALVTWENPDIEPINSASKAVRQATGHINLKSLDCNLLCVSSTPAGNMSDKKHIIHAIVPVSSLSQSDIQTLLRRTLQTVCGTDASAALTPLTTSQVKLEDFAKAFCHVTTEVMRERRVPEIHLIEKNPKVIAKLKEVFDSHLTLESEEDTMDINMAGATGGEKECSICKDSCKDPKTLKCGHRFCRECIDHYFNNYKPVCPNCGAIYGPVSGNMPDGKMYVRVNSYSHLPGHPSDGTISITYSIPNGIQKEEHPNPGKPYIGAYWTAYLPNSFEGEKVLRLLKVAFDRHLTFTVGRSVTTGVENKVTWNDIHHKTSHSGNFGYPDPDYLRRVHEELAAKGVTEADIDWSTPV